VNIDTLLFDLAGTTIDCGCMAPVAVFVEVFQRRGVTVSVAAARGPMGTHKREHIRRMCAEPEVAAAWLAARGAPPTEADIDQMYAEAEPLQVACLPDFVDPIPGFPSVAARLRSAGFRIGATTGYTRPMVAVLEAPMAARGWAPEVLVSASDVPAGRPEPWMNKCAAAALGTLDPARCVVFGDTVVDMEAARKAGMWAVGVALTGNEVGLDWPALQALSVAERAERRAQAGARLLAAGAHRLVDSALEAEAVIAELEQCAERP
jgi:phosphonoacetaldehyde hydrolase